MFLNERFAFDLKPKKNRVSGNLRAVLAVVLIWWNIFPGLGFVQAQEASQTRGQSGAAQSTSTSDQSSRSGQSSTPFSNPSSSQTPTSSQTSTLPQDQTFGQKPTPSATDKQVLPGQEQQPNPDQPKEQQPQKILVKSAPAPEPEPPQNPNAPQVQVQATPYPDIPSLTDLYSQIPTSSGPLTRFGSDAFRMGTGNTDELPDDLPVGPDFVLGTGDTLRLNLWGGFSDQLSRIIDRQGQIQLPEAGTLMINGLTIAQAQTAIQHALGTQFQNEKVEISIEKVHTVRVYVVGEVQRPGAYDVSALSTPLGALFAAGGPTSRGSLRVLRQYRGQQLVRQIDLYNFLLNGMHSEDERLLPGDTLIVPTVGPLVSIGGAVRRPAIYELNGEKDLNAILKLAGGVLITASMKQIEVERIQANEKRTMFSLKLPENLSDVQQQLASFQVNDGDIVFIKQIMPYNEQVVYLNGHVYQPGKYAYHEGMTVNDLVHSYQDILPEPGESAELVRLQPPDFHPVIIPFNLHDALLGNVSVPLQPFDTVRIVGRYTGEGPKVMITGEVNRPGTYPMFEGMKIADLLRMAGGFKRSAYRADADYTSYAVQDGKTVEVSHTTVPIQSILDGDKAADRLLKPDDVLTVRTLAGWQDIGASVTISGEVEHAGTYGIVPGERLSSLLKRAGGFRPDAYPYAGIMERVQVRQLNEQARTQMIQRIEETPIDFNPGTMTSQGATETQSRLLAQRQEILTALKLQPATGRIVINITADISSWENSPADIELSPGDILTFPKRPSFVAIAGQAYNPVAITYVPGKSVDWYLRQSGGVTPNGNKKDIYVLHANGSIAPRSNGIMKPDTQIRRGDVIFVPEKIAGASQTWQNILGVAQLLTLAAMPIAIALH
jgi:protein involved in polysaccharide export with SLBB domain